MTHLLASIPMRAKQFGAVQPRHSDRPQCRRFPGVLTITSEVRRCMSMCASLIMMLSASHDRHGRRAVRGSARLHCHSDVGSIQQGLGYRRERIVRGRALLRYQEDCLRPKDNRSAMRSPASSALSSTRNGPPSAPAEHLTRDGRRCANSILQSPPFNPKISAKP